MAIRHRPFEIGVLIACFLSSLIALVTAPTRTLQTIQEFMPGYAWIWYAGVLGGSGIGLISIFLRIPGSLIWERIGLTLLTFVLFGYSIVAILLLGAIGFSGAFFILTFAFAGVFRIVQLNRDIRSLKNIGGKS